MKKAYNKAFIQRNNASSNIPISQNEKQAFPNYQMNYQPFNIPNQEFSMPGNQSNQMNIPNFSNSNQQLCNPPLQGNQGFYFSNFEKSNIQAMPIQSLNKNYDQSRQSAVQKNIFPSFQANAIPFQPPPIYNLNKQFPNQNFLGNMPNEHSNIVAIEFKQLEKEEGIATGLPIKCKECSGLLSKVSKPYLKKTEDGLIWNCEFCSTPNSINLEDEEALNNSIVTYILGNEIKPKIDLNEEQKIPKSDEDNSIIFCIDISGSMDYRIYVKDAKPMKYSKNKSGPTRLECVKLAIDSQIQQMLKESPNTKVGFVLFEDRISVYGDCTNPPKTFEGEILNNFEGLLEAVGAQSNMFFSQPVKVSAPQLLQNLGSISTGGSTALGPGLVGALGLAIQGKKGSKIIICTDGLANEGMGSIKNSGDARPFYNKVGQIAKEKGIQISIITIVESECRLDMLSPIADLTGGNILRVNPLNLTNDFADFIAEKMVATKVNVEVRLHKALKFFKEDESNFMNGNKSVLKKEIGNVTMNSILSFEYGLKSDDELKLIPNFDINTLKIIPLQSIIYYENLKGFKCIRVISDTIETTEKLDEANEGRQADVIAAHGMQVVQKLAEKGSYQEAERESNKIKFELGNDFHSNLRVQQNFLPMYNAISYQNQMPANSVQTDNLTSAMNRAKKYY